jgi:hypothetical protein
VQSYAILNNNDVYADSTYPLSYVGNFSTYFMNSTLGSSILNSTLDLNQTTFRFFPLIIGIGVYIKIDDSLLAMDDSASGSKTAIYTFYGDESGIWTDNMSAYMVGNSFPTYNEPFTVQVVPPSSYYYSNSQPPPIEYYIKNKITSIMFSMNFLSGQYAQSLVCNFENPSGHAYEELNIFAIGVLSTLSITFALEAFTTFLKEKKEKYRDHE